MCHAGDVYDGLFPLFLDAHGAEHPLTARTGMGAFSDSFYEYLLKLWLHSGQQHTKLREAYDQAVEGLHRRLLHKSGPHSYVADFNGTHSDSSMHHLACFVPGMLALGAATAPSGTLGGTNARRDMRTAEELMGTCRAMAASQPTGLSPDCADFGSGKLKVAEGRADQYYFLRPEISESLYILYQLSGNETYRDWAWQIFEGIDKSCKTEVGYGVYSNVAELGLEPEDCMESFFLSETLKYQYLIFSNHSVSIREYVFNTEAHPFPLKPTQA